MSKKISAPLVFGIIVFLAIVLVGGVIIYQYYWKQVSFTPKQVVEKFYNQWISYSGEPVTRNPMADRIYQTSEYVTDDLVKKIDSILASFQGGGYDPVLCAQNIPVNVNFREATVSGKNSEVIVSEDFGGQVKKVKVSLRLINSEWKISDIACR